MTPPTEGDDMEYEIVDGSDGQPFIRVTPPTEGGDRSCMYCGCGLSRRVGSWVDGHGSALCSSWQSVIHVACGLDRHHPTEVEA
jgi:hypothetical protein